MVESGRGDCTFDARAGRSGQRLIRGSRSDGSFRGNAHQTVSVDSNLQTFSSEELVRGWLERIRGKEIIYPLGYMAGLDGARGLLTLGVLLAHTRMALFSGAMVYMDVFF